LPTQVQATVYIKYDDFFRVKLLVSNSDQISEQIDKMEKEANSIKDEAIHLSWHMRGGLSYEHALLLSVSEREAINKLIKSNMETTKNSGLPYF
jgi:hypothetical protein